jgi:hypothetical protein
MKLLRISAFAAIATLAGFSLACGSRETAKASSLFPNSNEVQGWTRSSVTRTFPAARLWEYIDGDADRFIQAGVVETLTTDYKYENKADAVADVYVMKTMEGARHILSSESTVGSEPITIGDAGRLSRSTVTFRKGPYFVRLIAYDETPEMPAALTALARAIEEKLGNATAR